MKLGYTTWGMPALPIDTALEHIAAAGYDGVEITVHADWTTAVARLDPAERRRVRARVDALGLELPAITAHGTLVGADAAVVAAGLAQVDGAIELAVQWAGPAGPPLVITVPGGTTDDWDDAARRAELVDNTQRLAAHAERAGVILAIEPHVLQIVDRPDRTRWLLDQVNSPALKVNFDISHFDVLGIPTEESVQALVPDGKAVHTHLKDQRGRSPDHEFLIPGEGDFDFVRYLTAMQAAGFTGYIVPEISLMVQRRPDYDPLAACTQSYVVLDRAFQAAGIARPVAGRT